MMSHVWRTHGPQSPPGLCILRPRSLESNFHGNCLQDSRRGKGWPGLLISRWALAQLHSLYVDFRVCVEPLSPTVICMWRKQLMTIVLQSECHWALAPPFLETGR